MKLNVHQNSKGCIYLTILHKKVFSMEPAVQYRTKSFQEERKHYVFTKGKHANKREPINDQAICFCSRIKQIFCMVVWKFTLISQVILGPAYSQNCVYIKIWVEMPAECEVLITLMGHMDGWVETWIDGQMGG